MTKQISLAQITDKDIARFWSHVDKSGECWIWTAGRISSGYGMFNCKSGRVYTHRFAWIITNGDIPNGLFVCHKCDNPPCVNPAHLFLGTVRDNARDSSAKGRNVFQKHPDLIRRGERHWSKIHPELIRRGDDSWSRNHLDRLARGEKGGCAKLTEQQVREIRQKRAHKQTLMSLASEYGVTLNAIYCVVKRITWRHVT